MSIQPAPTNAFLVPESAPFTDEQRAWLSGSANASAFMTLMAIFLPTTRFSAS